MLEEIPVQGLSYFVVLSDRSHSHVYGLMESMYFHSLQVLCETIVFCKEVHECEIIFFTR